MNDSPNQPVIHHIHHVNKSGTASQQLPSCDQGRLLERALNYAANRRGCVLARRQHVYTWMELQINLTINLTGKERGRLQTCWDNHTLKNRHAPCRHLNTPSYNWSWIISVVLRLFFVFLGMEKLTLLLSMVLKRQWNAVFGLNKIVASFFISLASLLKSFIHVLLMYLTRIKKE